MSEKLSSSAYTFFFSFKWIILDSHAFFLISFIELFSEILHFNKLVFWPLLSLLIKRILSFSHPVHLLTTQVHFNDNKKQNSNIRARHFQNKLQDKGVDRETNHSKKCDLPKICRNILFSSVILRIIESSNWSDREERDTRKYCWLGSERYLMAERHQQNSQWRGWRLHALLSTSCHFTRLTIEIRRYAT